MGTLFSFQLRAFFIMSTERTFIACKPDAVQRGLVAKIIARFEDKGFKLVGLKMLVPTKEFAEKHYADLAGKPFFPGMIEYFTSGPVVAMIWQGTNAVKTGRVLLGATNPADSVPGTIRGDYCIEVGRNICHGSDSVESAKAEIALWFPELEEGGLNWQRTTEKLGPREAFVNVQLKRKI